MASSPALSNPTQNLPLQEITQTKSTQDSNTQNGHIQKKHNHKKGENGTPLCINFPPSLCARFSVEKKKKDIGKTDQNISNNNNITSSKSTNNDPQQSLSTQTSNEVNDQFKQRYEALDEESKRCLLCFALFPENAIVKKRVLLYWWIAEGLPKVKSDKILDDLLAKEFIHPVHKKRRDQVVNSFKLNSYRMNPPARTVVYTIAQEAGLFYLNSEKKLISKLSLLSRACLFDAEEISTMQLQSGDPNQEKLKTLFNVSEKYPDFTPESFSKMKELNVLCLGRWQHSSAVNPEEHIEVGSAEFLNGLKNMKGLRLLSLHGVSRIETLPPSISKLTKLRVLDLRACYNLERLPKQIASLTMLTHLDISECYLLEYMPKALSSLKELQVLKGFVISDAPHTDLCDLEDLAANLKKLRKLSININSEVFKIEDVSTTIQKFKELQKLKVAWGAGSSEAKSQKPAAATLKPSVSMLKRFGTRTNQDQVAQVKLGLKKLDLQCFPWKTLPSWLVPENLKHLEKLYIRGGGVDNLGNEKWQVKVLRLKHLYELKMDWRKLQELFPDLKYLEKFKCPKITFCPCDDSGVWLSSSTAA